MPFLRDLFLACSTNNLVRQAVIAFPLSRRFTRRFIAGETLDDAITTIRTLNNDRILATLDHLGENVTSEAEARAAADDYLRALDAIAATGVRSHVSVKLTQMGLELSDDFCYTNTRRIAQRAKEIGSFLRIDMEGSAYTQRTLELFERLFFEFKNVGIVIQAYLYRSEADINHLIDLGANVRLCKGAYKEPANLAFPRKKDVDENFCKLVGLYLTPAAQEKGAYIAIATHDEQIIRWAREEVNRRQIPRNRFEFQMLYGIRRDLQLRLAASGYTMRTYVPYGTHWYPYFMRRLAERPANVIFLVSNLFK